MFGATLREHAERYDYAQEWLDTVKRAWGEEAEFDVEGRFLRLKQVRAKPKPFGGSRPIIMNAAVSPTGQAFAIRNCDALFSNASLGKLDAFTAHVKNVQAQARAQHRDIEVYTVGVVTCRPSNSEAQDYYRYCVIDNADWAAVDHIMAMRGATREAYPEDFEKRRLYQANGMGGLPIVGDPDQVAAELQHINAAGARGIALSFVNYLDELPFFCVEVLPRLARMGLRHPPFSQ